MKHLDETWEAMAQNDADQERMESHMATMNAVFDRFAKDCIPKLAPRTQIDYGRHLVVLRQHFGHLAPSAIKPKDIGRFLDVDRSFQMRNKQVSVLSAVFGKAVGKWYVVDTNPCQNVERHETHPRTRYITDQEFHAVRGIAPPVVQIMMDLALITGQRCGDILDLSWEMIETDHIRLTQSKTGKSLGIRLTPDLVEVLLRARRRAPMWPRWFVIRTRTGEPYTHEGWRAKWQIVMNTAMRQGVIKKRFTFHDLRAKCASDKDNLQDASALLGHSDVGLTRRIYDRNIRMVDPLR